MEVSYTKKTYKYIVYSGREKNQNTKYHKLNGIKLLEEGTISSLSNQGI